MELITKKMIEIIRLNFINVLWVSKINIFSNLKFKKNNVDTSNMILVTIYL